MERDEATQSVKEKLSNLPPEIQSAILNQAHATESQVNPDLPSFGFTPAKRSEYLRALETIADILNDPRNSWIGLGPVSAGFRVPGRIIPKNIESDIDYEKLAEQARALGREIGKFEGYKYPLAPGSPPRYSNPGMYGGADRSPLADSNAETRAFIENELREAIKNYTPEQAQIARKKMIDAINESLGSQWTKQNVE